MGNLIKLRLELDKLINECNAKNLSFSSLGVQSARDQVNIAINKIANEVRDSLRYWAKLEHIDLDEIDNDTLYEMHVKHLSTDKNYWTKMQTGIVGSDKELERDEIGNIVPVYKWYDINKFIARIEQYFDELSIGVEIDIARLDGKDVELESGDIASSTHLLSVTLNKKNSTDEMNECKELFDWCDWFYSYVMDSYDYPYQLRKVVETSKVVILKIIYSN